MVANVIACVDAGIAYADVKVVVGHNGGTVTNGRVVFQTPVITPLNDIDARALFNAFAELLERYEADALDADYLNRIRDRFGVPTKVQRIRDVRDWRS